MQDFTKLHRRLKIACKSLPWDKASKVAIRWIYWATENPLFPRKQKVSEVMRAVAS